MRKSLILMLIATLLVGAFLVSCNSDISSESSNGDKLVKVTIAGNSKGISAVSTSDDADNYYWYYSATKDDTGVYRTGQTEWKAVKANNETGLSGADLGYFSSGDWKFSFYGYTTAQNTKPTDPITSSVYYQKDNAVKVVKTTDTPTYVSVTLKEGSLGETATLVIETMNWKYTPENPTDYSATLANLGDNKTATIHFSYLSGTNTYTDIGTADGTVELYTSADTKTTNASEAAYAKAIFSFTGNYTIPASIDGKENTIKFWVTIGNETVGDEDSINVVAYSGGVVTLSIDSTGVAVYDNEAFNKVIIDENTIGFTAKRSVAVSENGSVEKTIVTKAAPSTDSNVTTSITFPEGALVASAVDNTTYDVEMDVVVYQTEAAQAKFVIEDTSTTAPSTFAGLDISATLTTTTGTGSSTSPVSQFSDNTAVTIRTYIAKNLTGVQVVYNGSAGAQPTFSGVSFNSEEEFAVSSYETGYVKSTGLLVFKTTHFSEFFVGANEKVYDKKTNSGYTVAAFNNLSASDISDHEFILLDASVANEIDDSHDVFNANYKWTVVHGSTDHPDTNNFAGGYGTKIEPYLIASTANMQKISELYDNNVYSYFKVETAGSVFDASNWTAVNINGSFDGNGATFNNLNQQLFRSVGKAPSNFTYIIKNTTVNANININGYGAAMIRQAGNNLVVENVTVNGYIEGNNGAAAFVCFGPGNIASSNGSSQSMNWVFRNCYSGATIVATGDVAVGFVKHPYCYASQSGGVAAAQECCLLTIEDSIFNGTLYHIGDSQYNYKYFVGNANNMLVKTIYSNDFISQHGNPEGIKYTAPATKTDDGVFFIGNYPGEGNKITDYATYGTCMDKYLGANYQLDQTSGTLPEKYSVFTVPQHANAVTAKAMLEIAPNDPAGYGSYLGTYMTEEIELTNGAESFTTSTIKYFDITINAEANPGLTGNKYNVVNSEYGTTHNGAGVRVVQYSSSGSVVSTTYFKIADKMN